MKIWQLRGCLILLFLFCLAGHLDIRAQSKNPTPKRKTKVVKPAPAAPADAPAPAPQLPTEPEKKNQRSSDQSGTDTTNCVAPCAPQNSGRDGQSGLNGVTASAAKLPGTEETTYSYEFSQPAFTTRKIKITHDGDGKGSITFERSSVAEAITDPVELSPAALKRVISLWNELNFLDADRNYQSERQYPHMGTMWLSMKRGSKSRTAEFNWTSDKQAFSLVNEYKAVADQAMFVFDINLARELQPLTAPDVLRGLEVMVRRKALSDPAQLVPLLRDLTVDERIPLIARTYAGKILKVIVE